MLQKTTFRVRWDNRTRNIGVNIRNPSVVSCSYIMTNQVIVQCEDFLLISVELDHRSALVLVPLENTAHLNIYIL